MSLPGPAIRSLHAALLLIASAGPVGAAQPGTEVPAGTEGVGSDAVLLLVFVLLALGFSFLCSVAESVLLSLTPAYIESRREDSPQLASLLNRLRIEQVDRSLAAILTLNTIAHTVGAIVAGAKATVVFGSAWIGLFSAVMTLLILFFSEIVPKTIGAVHWQRLAGPTAAFVRVLILVLHPLVWISEVMTKWIARGRVAHVFSREELVAMAGIGERTGHVAETESRIIRNLFKLGSLRVVDVMTPRVVISALRRDLSVEEALLEARFAPFSRLPVYGRDLDDITGFVLKDELLLLHSQGKGEEPLTTIEREIIAVSATMSLSMLLDFLLERRQHLVLVVDEYGGTRGLATLEDALETLLGLEIVDEMDDVEDMRAHARQRWRERARARGLDVDPEGLGAEAPEADSEPPEPSS